MFIIGLVLFLPVSKARDRVGQIGFWIFIGFVLLIYAGNVFGGPPPNVRALAWLGMSQWIFVPWMYWLDRHRSMIVRPQTLTMSA
jgi:hypothetical protein